VLTIVQETKPDLLIHCAAQLSHDLASTRQFDDFDVNSVGTLNLLEATRRHASEAVFILLSANKVYGDLPNELPLVELPTPYYYADLADREEIAEKRIPITLINPLPLRHTETCERVLSCVAKHGVKRQGA
jgi:CDP-paratose 2-epimerase